MQIQRREFLGRAAALGAAALVAPRAVAAQYGLLTTPIPSNGERIPVIGIGIGTNRYRSGEPTYVQMGPTSDISNTFDPDQQIRGVCSGRPGFRHDHRTANRANGGILISSPGAPT